MVRVEAEGHYLDFREGVMMGLGEDTLGVDFVLGKAPFITGGSSIKTGESFEVLAGERIDALLDASSLGRAELKLTSSWTVSPPWALEVVRGPPSGQQRVRFGVAERGRRASDLPQSERAQR